VLGNARLSAASETRHGLVLGQEQDSSLHTRIIPVIFFQAHPSNSVPAWQKHGMTALFLQLGGEPSKHPASTCINGWEGWWITDGKIPSLEWGAHPLRTVKWLGRCLQYGRAPGSERAGRRPDTDKLLTLVCVVRPVCLKAHAFTISCCPGDHVTADAWSVTLSIRTERRLSCRPTKPGARFAVGCSSS